MSVLGTQSELRDELRADVGRRDETVLVTDQELDNAFNEALRSVNKHWPIYAISSFVTVAAQQVYTVVLPLGGRRILEVYWDGGIPQSFDFCESEAQMQELINASGGYVPRPSQLLIWNRLVSYQEVVRGARVTINGLDVYLNPIPGKSGKNVYYKYITNRFTAYQDVTDDNLMMSDAFMARAKQRMHETLSVGAGAISRVNGADGIDIDTTAAAEHRRQAKLRADEFHGNLPLFPPF